MSALARYAHRRRATAATLALGALALAGPAQAQRRRPPSASPPPAASAAPANPPPAAPAAPAAPVEPPLSEERVAEARRSFQRGVELLQAGRYGDAVGALQAARAIRATPPVHYNLGLALRGAGRSREAIGAFRAYLASAGDNAPEAVRAQVTRTLGELAQTLARVTVVTEPADARVLVDGEPVDAASGALELDPGARVLSADAPGHFPETRRVELMAGEQRTVRLRLPPQNAVAHVVIESNVPSARIVVDGQHVGSGSVEENLTPGPHTIEVSAPRHGRFSRTLVAVAGNTTRVRAVLDAQTPWYATPWPWLGLAVVAGGATAVGLYAAGVGQTEPPVPGTWGVVMAVTAE